jgi:hypothetical protein
LLSPSSSEVISDSSVFVFTTKGPYKRTRFITHIWYDKKTEQKSVLCPYICYDKRTIQKTELLVLLLSRTFVTTKRPNKRLCLVPEIWYDRSFCLVHFVSQSPMVVRESYHILTIHFKYFVRLFVPLEIFSN